MQRILFALVCALGLLTASRAAAQAITIATVPVGNPGNPNLSYGTPMGEVDYNYSIGKYDVTVSQYAAFLNTVAASDPYHLYNHNMGTDLNCLAIARSGSSGSYTYSVIGSPNHPITYITWGDAVRFANWLSNGQPTGPEGSGTTETGSYTLNGATTYQALDTVTRNPNATWVLPTDNEWFKAAYYNATTETYYWYPFSSNAMPTSAPPSNTPNSGNFLGDNGYALTGSGNYDPNQNYLTDVGAYTASASPYGGYDMGGDVLQWDEGLLQGDLRIERGASWIEQLSAQQLSYNFASLGNSDAGFRVALVPEPSTLMLASIACGLIWTCRKRRK
jgi:formylglycine-generating enzyme required for sulfatase activity